MPLPCCPRLIRSLQTWNQFACGTSDTVLRETAQVMVQLGLRDLGYIFVNSDDCWLLAERDANGNLQVGGVHA